MKGAELKSCFGCVCDFAHFIKFNKFPYCDHDEKLLQGSFNTFQ